MNRPKTNLEQEAAKITSELGDVVFIGAVAVLLHTKSGRESKDLDFVVATKLSDEFLEGKGYSKNQEGGKTVRRTPRGIKIDIYTEPIKDVRIETIMNTAKEVVVNPRRGIPIKIASLEILIVLKHRAGRNQDIEDIRLIAKRRFDKIDWKKLESLTYDNIEFLNIKTALEFHHNGY